MTEQKDAIDKWTAAHFLAGLGSGAVKIKTGEWAAIAIGWELLEQAIIVPHKPEWKESKRNSAADVIAGVAGNLIGHFVRKVID